MNRVSSLLLNSENNSFTKVDENCDELHFISVFLLVELTLRQPLATCLLEALQLQSGRFTQILKGLGQDGATLMRTSCQAAVVKREQSLRYSSQFTSHSTFKLSPMMKGSKG